MKTLVTGAGGFIGSHLVESLVRDGVEVKAFVHYNSRNEWGLLEGLPGDVLSHVEVVPGDIQDSFVVDRAVQGCSVVYHLASLIAIPYSYVAPHSYVATNVMGTVNVLQACLAHRVDHVIHTSTSECYGTAQYVPIDEEHPLQGQSPYSASKIGADKIAESYWRSFGLPVATIRPFNTYGPRQSARAVVPTIITQALTGGMIKLGSLGPTRDLTFVGDTVRGFMLMGRCSAAVGQVVNLGSGKEISIGELAKLVVELVGRRAKIEKEKQRVRPERSEVERLVCNNERARSMLGWEPEISLNEGLTRTIAWIGSNIGRFKAGMYNI